MKDKDLLCDLINDNLNLEIPKINVDLDLIDNGLNHHKKYRILIKRFIPLYSVLIVGLFSLLFYFLFKNDVPRTKYDVGYVDRIQEIDYKGNNYINSFCRITDNSTIDEVLSIVYINCDDEYYISYEADDNYDSIIGIVYSLNNIDPNYGLCLYLDNNGYYFCYNNNSIIDYYSLLNLYNFKELLKIGNITNETCYNYKFSKEQILEFLYSIENTHLNEEVYSYNNRYLITCSINLYNLNEQKVYIADNYYLYCEINGKSYCFYIGWEKYEEFIDLIKEGKNINDQ